MGGRERERDGIGKLVAKTEAKFNVVCFEKCSFDCKHCQYYQELAELFLPLSNEQMARLRERETCE